MFKNKNIKQKLILILILLQVFPIIFLSLFSIERNKKMVDGFQGKAKEIFIESKDLMSDLAKFSMEKNVESLDEKFQENAENMAYMTSEKVYSLLQEITDKTILISNQKIDKSFLKDFKTRENKIIKYHLPLQWDDQSNSWIDAAKNLRTTNLQQNKMTSPENSKMFRFFQESKIIKKAIPTFKEISYFDLSGMEKFKSSDFDEKLKNISLKENTYLSAENYFSNIGKLKKGEVYISDIIGEYVFSKVIGVYNVKETQKLNIPFEPDQSAYAGKENPIGKKFQGILRFITPVFSDSNKIGYISLALDHEHLMNITDYLNPIGDSIQKEIPDASSGNYIFMQDYLGRTIAHPRNAYIVGFDGKSGERVPPWVDQEIYDQWKNSGNLTLNQFLENYPPYFNQSRSKRPSVDQLKQGFLGTDCRYLNFAPQCSGWRDIIENNSHGSFLIHWSGNWMLTAVAPIKLPDQVKNPYPRFGHVIVNTNIDNIHLAGLKAKDNIAKILESQNDKLTKKLMVLKLNLTNDLDHLFYQIIYGAIFFILVLIICSIVISEKMTSRIRKLSKNLKNISSFSDKDEECTLDDSSQDEIGHLTRSFKELIQRLKLSNEVKMKAEFEKSKFQIASQVAHDIRSPLAALNMAVRDLTQIPEEKRIIIRGSVNRIQDIANNLLTKKRELKSNNNGSATGSIGSFTVQLISGLLDGIISEKRMEYRSKLGVEIEFNPDRNSYGLFAKIQSHEFKRVISNLINNSVEALGDSGKIQVSLSNKENMVEIKITDNGKGIPEEILKKLGENEETHGKSEGNGIGIYHAKKYLQSWQGHLDIHSQVSIGTTITITIPRCDVPPWFVPTLKLKENSTIIVIDDDSTIHQIWNERFEEKKVRDYGINIFHFSMPSQLVEWTQKNKNVENVIYLSDFEFLGHELNGLDLIEKLNLAQKAILVTSRYEEKSILEKCQSLGVALIPKGMAESVPIEISSNRDEQNTDSFFYDVVYIDDDQFLRMGWESSAKSKGMKILTLPSPKEIDKFSSNISQQTKIYLDHELGKGEMKGDEWAKILYDQGYRNLYLATGYDKDYFPELAHLEGIIGKDPPWEVD